MTKDELLARVAVKAKEEAFDEAKGLVDSLAAELSRLAGASGRRVQIGSHLELCSQLSQGITALRARASLTEKE